MSGGSAPSATPNPSASGARFVGDDLQHLVGWYHLLRMLRPENGIASVTLESLGAGNLDDVVVAYHDGHSDFHQVKAVVSAETALSTEWLQRSVNGGPSILQRFHAAWKEIQNRGIPAQLELVTNRSIDPGDHVLECRDANGHLGPCLRRATPASMAGQGRRQWADHVGVDEEELCQLLDVLRFSTDALEATWRRNVVDVAQGLGLKTDEASLLAGVGKVREWVKASRMARTEADVHQAIRDLDLQATEPYAVLLIQALDRSDPPETVTAIDWVDRFVGDDPRNRRGLHQPADWNAVLLPELRETAKRVRAENARVLVRGEMRLPVWFAAGTALSDVSGATPAARQKGEVWSAGDDNGYRPEVLVLDEHRVGGGTELAIIISISTDIAASVHSFLQGDSDTGTCLTLALAPGPDRLRIGSSSDAIGAAVALRDRVRAIVAERRPTKVHLFLAMPGALAFLLGHVWDRMPPTQLYEDLLTSYQPAFLIAN